MSDLVEQYQAQTETLAAGAVTQVAAVYAALQAGQITTAETRQLIAAVVATANAAASALADAFVSAQIEHATGIPTPTVGLPPRDDTERLTLATHTILNAVSKAPPEHVAATVSGNLPEAGKVGAPEPVSTAAMRFERLGAWV
jgi:hypothetical protein